MIKITAFINHEPRAIEAHMKNHPMVQLLMQKREEGIEPIPTDIGAYKPAVIWDNLECINFSSKKSK